MCKTLEINSSLYSAWVWPPMEFGAPHLEMNKKIKRIQRTAKRIRGLQSVSCEERLQELGLFSLKKNDARGYDIIFQDGGKEDSVQLFSMAPEQKTRRNQLNF